MNVVGVRRRVCTRGYISCCMAPKWSRGGGHMSVWSMLSTLSRMFALSLVTLMPLTTSASGYFPEGSCTNNACDLAPYQLAWSSPVPVSPVNTFCFRISMSSVPCVADPFQCCQEFETTLTKVVLTTLPVCAAMRIKVSVNGVYKAGGVYFDPITDTLSQLRITNLQMNASNVVGAGVLVCITAAPPCNTMESFCGINCRYALYDPARHVCCPTCPMLLPGSAPTSPSDAPPPPSPPPPRSPPPPPPPPPPRSPPPPPPPPPPGRPVRVPSYTADK